jgi:hypothetical protein
MNKKNDASIVVISLMLLSVIILLTEQLFRNTYVGASFTKTMVERECAESLALGGINLAISQLIVDEGTEEDKKGKSLLKQSKETETEGDKKDFSPVQKFLYKVLPHLNRWQVFDLDEKTDGIDGFVKICISCENGKINLNEIFDFEKQVFLPEYDALLKALEIEGEMKGGEIATKLEEFLKNRRKKIYDISELHAIEGFENIDVFYKPPKVASKKGERSGPNQNVALQDIFTVWTEDSKMEPAMLSDSMCAILGFRRPISDDSKTMDDKFKQFATSFKENIGANIEENWQIFEPIYVDKPSFLQNIQNVFSKQFGPTVYSVLSYGKVGNVEQGILAIIKKADEKKQPQEKKDASLKVEEEAKKEEEDKVFFKVVRLYWI